jgi:RNA polymerase sigma-70 factor (ECF subfamily)
MRHFGFGLEQMGLVGIAPQEDGKSVPGFEELAMPLFDSLYNFARWMAQDSHDAEDIVQETYLKALRAFASFRPGTNFRAWIFRILKNTFLSSRSQRKRRMTVAMDLEDDGLGLAIEYETPDSILTGRSDSESVQRAISGLPAHFREVLLLCQVEEMSYRNIAEVLSIPIGTVMSRLARARKAVRESVCSTSSAPVSSAAAQEGGGRRKASIRPDYARVSESVWQEPRLGP